MNGIDGTALKAVSEMIEKLETMKRMSCEECTAALKQLETAEKLFLESAVVFKAVCLLCYDASEASRMFNDYLKGALAPKDMIEQTMLDVIALDIMNN